MFLVTQLCLTLCDFRDLACQAPLAMEFSRPEYWSGLPCHPPGDLPNPGFEARSPALQADSSPSEPQGKPIEGIYLNIIKIIYGKPIASIIFNSERLNAFYLRSGTRQQYLFLLILFNIIANEIRQESEIKYTVIGKNSHYFQMT